MSSFFFFFNLKSGTEIKKFMNNVICEERARKLHSISITWGYCYLRRKIMITLELNVTCVIASFVNLKTFEKHSHRKVTSEIFTLDKCK